MSANAIIILYASILSLSMLAPFVLLDRKSKAAQKQSK